MKIEEHAIFQISRFVYLGPIIQYNKGIKRYVNPRTHADWIKQNNA